MGEKLFEKDNVPKDRRTIEELVDRRCLLEGVDLTYADLKGADLKGAHFLSASMMNADLRFADLSEKLWGPDEDQGTKAGKYFVSSLKNCKLSDANLEGANLHEALCQDANFQGANLEGVDLSDADLKHANLSNANLEGASLDGASLDGTILYEAKLSGVRHADLKKVIFKDRDYEGITYNEMYEKTRNHDHWF